MLRQNKSSHILALALDDVDGKLLARGPSFSWLRNPGQNGIAHPGKQALGISMAPATWNPYRGWASCSPQLQRAFFSHW